jgi:hypothetical protein
MAYILSAKRDSIDPLYTIRRMIVSGTWTTGMMNATESTLINDFIETSSLK